MLSDRQELVLRKVVEEYLEAGVPVGSKLLSAEVEWGPSTIRSELANLEELGLLAHPHTSAGRIPTEAGYRYFVDQLLTGEIPDTAPRLSLSLMRRELDEAMRVDHRDALAGHQPARDRDRARRSRPRRSGTSRCSRSSPRS